MTIFEKIHFLVDKLDYINHILNSNGICDYTIVTSKNTLAHSPGYTEFFIETDNITDNDRLTVNNYLNRLHPYMVFNLVENGTAYGMMLGCVTLYTSNSVLKEPEARDIVGMATFK